MEFPPAVATLTVFTLLLTAPAALAQGPCPTGGPEPVPVAARAETPKNLQRPDAPAPAPDLPATLKRIETDLQSRDRKTRSDAVAELLDLPAVHAIPTLIEAVDVLKGEEWRPCGHALIQAGRDHPTHEAWAALDADLKRRLADRRSLQNGQKAALKISALFAAGGGHGMARLRQALTRGIDPAVLIRAVGVHSTPDLVDWTAAFATNRRVSPHVRRRAIRALGRFGWGPPVYARRIPALLLAARFPDTHQDALRALQNVAPVARDGLRQWEAWWRENRDAPDDLSIVRQSLEPLSRPCAGEISLGPVLERIRNWNTPGFAWVAPLFHQWLSEEDMAPLSSALLSNLSGMGSPGSIGPILSHLGRQKGHGLSEQHERCLALEALAGLAELAGDEERASLAAQVRPLLDDLSRDVVAQAALTLAAARDAAAAPAIRDMLSQTPDRAFPDLIRALSQFGEKRDCRLLVKLFRKAASAPDPGAVRAAVLEACVRLDVGTDGEEEIAIVGAQDPDERVCGRAVAWLSRFPGENAFFALRSVLEDPRRSEKLRLSCFETLARIARDDQVPHLILLLGRTPATAPPGTDRERALRARIRDTWWDRVAAKVTGSESHLEALLTVAGDEKAPRQGRLTALKCLGRDGVYRREPCENALIRLLDDPVGEIVGPVSDFLAAHPSMEILDALIGALPDSGRAATWQDTYRWHVVREALGAGLRGRLPDFGLNGVRWRAWWRVARSRVRFPD